MSDKPKTKRSVKQDMGTARICLAASFVSMQILAVGSSLTLICNPNVSLGSFWCVWLVNFVMAYLVYLFGVVHLDFIEDHMEDE